MHFRFRWKKRGGHVHVRMFSADRAEVTHAKCGDLCFREEEWRVFRDCLHDFGDVEIEIVSENIENYPRCPRCNAARIESVEIASSWTDVRSQRDKDWDTRPFVGVTYRCHGEEWTEAMLERDAVALVERMQA
jgi:hypothetical protein